MGRIGLTITFMDEDGTARRESQDVETSYTLDAAGEHRMAHILFSELKVTVGEHPAPKYNAVARGWLDFPNRPVRFQTPGLSHERQFQKQHFDIQNSQALWFELANLVMRAEGDLFLAQAFKALEPAQQPSFGDDTAINDLYYVHDRKMTFMNQAVYALIKVQDLVNRLLHESLGGDLVNTSKTEWETNELKVKPTRNGLEAKRKTGSLSQSDFDAITQALEIPKNCKKGGIALDYRNRLMHHIRPSVDYSLFYSGLEPREGEEWNDTQENVIGRRWVMRAEPPVQYLFQDLHAAVSEYLDAVVAMLQKLSEMEILRR